MKADIYMVVAVSWFSDFHTRHTRAGKRFLETHRWLDYEHKAAWEKLVDDVNISVYRGNTQDCWTDGCRAHTGYWFILECSRQMKKVVVA